MTLKEKAAKYIEKHEGNYSYMYLDHKGLVTVGIGHYLPNAADAMCRPFRNKKTLQPATPQQIEAEWQKLKDMNSLNRRAIYFKDKTELELSGPDVEKLFLSEDLEKKIPLSRLEKEIPGFKEAPESAKIALWDMAFALGIGGLKKFTKLQAAVKAGDWHAAAVECKIGDTPGTTRYHDNRDMFLSCLPVAPFPAGKCLLKT